MSTRIDQFSPGTGNTRVLPGHGRQTTIAMAEKQFDSWVAAGPVLGA